MPLLVLPVMREYFDAIKSGEKLEEYRLVTDHWRKRIEGKTFTNIRITLGYPKKTDTERMLVRPWRGYTRKKIIHPHFGDDPVYVYAIKVN